jgi:hypothetical protein
LRRFPAAYLAVVVAVAASRGLTGHPPTRAWGLTPDELGAGKVWLIATSALVVNGSPVPQLVALALTIVAALRHMPARWVTAVMVVAHVGATLLAYGVLLLATGEADGVHSHTNDYGTSAVWLGLLGALVVASLREALADDWLARAFIPAALVMLAGAVAFFPLMTSTEHALAFALGAGIAAIREVRRFADPSARFAASTASSRAGSA